MTTDAGGAAAALERARAFTFDDDDQFTIREAGALLTRWKADHGADIYGTDRALADAVGGLLAILDRLRAGGSLLRLSLAGSEGFAKLFVSATWLAGANTEQMRQEDDVTPQSECERNGEK